MGDPGAFDSFRFGEPTRFQRGAGDLGFDHFRYGEPFGGKAPSGADPYKVTGLTATAISSTRIDLVWNDVSALAGHSYGFDIERNSAVIVEYYQGGTAYSDTTCAPSTEYTYRVRAVETV